MYEIYLPCGFRLLTMSRQQLNNRRKSFFSSSNSCNLKILIDIIQISSAFIYLFQFLCTKNTETNNNQLYKSRGYLQNIIQNFNCYIINIYYVTGAFPMHLNVLPSCLSKSIR